MSSAREEILERIAATVGQPTAEAAAEHAYRRSGALDDEKRVELFCRRVGEYRAEVHRVDEAGLATLISTICGAREARRLVVPPGIPAAWRAAGVELIDDDGLAALELDALDGAVTGCTAAIAETGTIVLTAGPLEGRRALTLVPDLHVCVVREPQIVQVLPQALAKIAADRLERRPITFISGPSATSDIELSRVEGVHGPRALVVLVVKESP
ncbi:MAG TPA: lactate utilization protein C [Gaiellaceae bacterium]|nr:lactate utilization protein C [Gaiellaceae bacterium]